MLGVSFRLLFLRIDFALASIHDILEGISPCALGRLLLYAWISSIRCECGRNAPRRSIPRPQSSFVSGGRGKVLQISGILYDVVISKPSNHGLKNMSDLDLSDATRRLSTREGDNREDHTP
jgi:hypothetical protein